jgi:hypothetical protein
MGSRRVESFKDPTTQPPPKPPLRLIRVVYVLANEGYGGLALCSYAEDGHFFLGTVWV